MLSVHTFGIYYPIWVKKGAANNAPITGGFQNIGTRKDIIYGSKWNCITV